MTVPHRVLSILNSVRVLGDSSVFRQPSTYYIPHAEILLCVTLQAHIQEPAASCAANVS